MSSSYKIATDQVPSTSAGKSKATKKKGIMKLTCSVCGKNYGSLQSLRRHMNINHTARPTGYQCPICDRVLNRLYNYKKHSRNLHGFGEDVPSPIITTYSPKDLATKPVIKRPWEALTIDSMDRPTFRIRPATPNYMDNNKGKRKPINYDNLTEEQTLQIAYFPDSDPENSLDLSRVEPTDEEARNMMGLSPLSDPSLLHRDLYLSSDDDSNCSTSSSSSSGSSSSGSSSSSDNSISITKEEFIYSSSSSITIHSQPTPTGSTSTIDYNNPENLIDPDNQLQPDEWDTLDAWTSMPFECE